MRTTKHNLRARVTRQELSRRDFVRVSAGLAGAFGLLSLPRELNGAEQEKWVVACRDIHLKTAAKPDCWASLRELGAEGVEVSVDVDLSCPNLLYPSGRYTLATGDGLQKLGEDAAQAKNRLTAFVMANRFDERLEQELQWARKLVKAAQQLGVRAIRIDVWPHKLNEQEFFPFAVKTCKQLCEMVEGSDVRFGIENHGKVTNNPEFLENLFGEVGSNHLGLTLDCANFYWFGHPLEDLYGIYRKFASRVFHTHCKSIRYPEDRKNSRRPMGWEYDKYNCPIYEGDIDFKRLIGILREANYRGDLCVEDESLGKFPEVDRAGVIRKELAFLKQLR